MKCNICGNASVFAFKKIVLKKYEVSYFRCQHCGFIQTEKPYWLGEAYASPFSAVDTGLISRPLSFSKTFETVIMKYCDPKSRFLDYGGGNGVFVRIMRDKGFNFYRLDKYATNIYALGFDLLDVNEDDRKFELLTSIEVLEHFQEPMIDIAEMFSYGNTLLCTTLLQETVDESDIENWFYLAEFSGQHISFYTRKSMKIIADHFNCYYYTNGVDIHLFTQKKINNIGFSDISGINYVHTATNFIIKYVNKINDKFFYKVLRSKPDSLTMKDQEYLKKKLFGSGRNF